MATIRFSSAMARPSSWIVGKQDSPGSIQPTARSAGASKSEPLVVACCIAASITERLHMGVRECYELADGLLRGCANTGVLASICHLTCARSGSCRFVHPVQHPLASAPTAPAMRVELWKVPITIRFRSRCERDFPTHPAHALRQFRFPSVATAVALSQEDGHQLWANIRPPRISSPSSAQLIQWLTSIYRPMDGADPSSAQINTPWMPWMRRMNTPFWSALRAAKLSD